MPPTATQARIVAIADDLAARFAARAPQHDADSSFPHENWADLHGSGYLRLVIPREYGGEGVSVLDMAIAQERLARGCASTALGAAMLISVLGRAVEVDAWPEPVLAEICRELAGAGGGLNNCVTETELGSISRGGTPLTGAERVDGGWLVTGHKIFVTAAPALRFLVTGLVLPGDEQSPQGYMASAIVRNPSPGLRIERTWRDALSLRAAGNDDVYYDRVFVPDEWVVERRPLGVRAESRRTRRQSMGADRRRRLSRSWPGRARGRLRVRAHPRAALAGHADRGAAAYPAGDRLHADPARRGADRAA